MFGMRPLPEYKFFEFLYLIYTSPYSHALKEIDIDKRSIKGAEESVKSFFLFLKDTSWADFENSIFITLCKFPGITLQNLSSPVYE
jgi:hypothetical protein